MNDVMKFQLAPPPWRCDKYQRGMVVDADGMRVIEMQSDLAAEVVKRVNAFDAMVAALEHLIAVGEENYDMDMGDSGPEAIEVARAALLAARSP